MMMYVMIYDGKRGNICAVLQWYYKMRASKEIKGKTIIWFIRFKTKIVFFFLILLKVFLFQYI